MAESLWKRLGPAPLEVEGYELERLEQPVTRGFTRVTTVVHLRGGGQEGLGEDVTWYPEHHDREQAGRRRPAARRQLDARVVLGRARDARPAPALGLRERRARPRAAPGGTRASPRSSAASRARSAFVVSPGLGDPPTSRVVLRWLELDAEPPLQARPRRRLDRPADRRRSPTTGAVVTADYKAYYRDRGRPAARPRALPARGRGLSRRLPRGPGADRRDRRRARAAPRARHLGRADPLGRRRRGARLRRRACSTRSPRASAACSELLAFYDYCDANEIALYGGGMFELGPGRGQIQYLASLFHPDGPNDVAPRAYNDPEPRPGLPPSPLPPAPGRRGVSVARARRYSLTD